VKLYARKVRKKSFSETRFLFYNARRPLLFAIGDAMRFTALGGCSEVGANAYHLEIDGTGILLDAGIHPKKYGLESLPLIEVVRRKEIDAVLISHCHIDHLGALPVLLKYFPTPRVFMTQPSLPIAMRMLHNTVTVMGRLREEKGIEEYPFYTHEDIDLVAPLFQPMDYDTPFVIMSRWSFWMPATFWVPPAL
jgi:Cft2 family RNA processing exonuclease